MCIALWRCACDACERTLAVTASGEATARSKAKRMAAVVAFPAARDAVRDITFRRVSILRNKLLEDALAAVGEHEDVRPCCRGSRAS